MKNNYFPDMYITASGHESVCIYTAIDVLLVGHAAWHILLC
jgi:hypothetical protein